MATIVVNANTAQAAGAFAALTAAVNQSRASIQNLQVQINAGTTNNNNYTRSLAGMHGGFHRLSSIIDGVYDSARMLAGGLELVFNKILKTLDQIQGFNAIMSVTTGPEQVVVAYNFLRETANRLGVEFQALSSNYAKLVAALPEGNNRMAIAEKVFTGVAMAARTLHASTQDTQLMFYAVTQMASKGVVSMEELRRQLGEKLPGVINIAAASLKVLPEELEAAIRKGTVNSEKFLAVFGEALIKKFADSSAKAADSVSASLARLSNVWQDYVKEILDSGAATSIIGFFDALREKLSDPYLIERFAQLVKQLADRFAEFIESITREDMQKGFDTLANGATIALNILEKFIGAIQWIINNAHDAGVIIGGITGAAAGLAIGGPVGAGVGAIAGMTAGSFAGGALAPSASQTAARDAANQSALDKAAKSKADQESVKFNQLIPLLQQFKDLKSLDTVQNLMSADRLNQKTIKDIEGILNNKDLNTDKSKLESLQMYSKSGQILTQGDKTLKDVLQASNKKPKRDRQAESEMASILKSAGLDANFLKEWDNYNKIFAKGKMTTEQLTDAQAKLLDKQPFMEEAAKAARKEREADNKAFEQFMQLLLKQIEVQDEVYKGLQEEQRMAGMRGEDAQIESQLINISNQYKTVGLTLQGQERDILKEKLILIQRENELTSAKDQVLAATVDKYRQQIVQQQAMDALLKDPSSGLTATQATDLTVNQDPNMQGSPQWLEAQKRSMEEYYLFIDLLRQKDRISEETASMAKAQAGMAYKELELANTKGFFTSLSSLSSSGNKKIAAIGRAAAITTATIDGYVAVQKALASAPPPVNYALAVAAGIQAAANVANIAGVTFATGGYTGNGAVGDVAGVTHGREFVVNANATARNRATLESINSGRGVPSGDGQNVTVIVNNNASGTTATKQERQGPSGREIEITIEQVMTKQVRTGGPVAQALESQYGLNRASGTVR